nr:hypothetical protein [Tanacetum cinerariifolium]
MQCRMSRISPTEGNGNGINGNLIRCYSYRGERHYANSCTVKPNKRDAAYLQQQLQIAQKEESTIQSTQEEFEFMAAADAYEETKRVKASCILENNLQQASTSGEGHYASNCIVKPRKQDAAYLQHQLQMAQEEEAGIQSIQEEFKFMASVDTYEEIEKVTANCNLQDNLQQASTSGTQSDKAPVYDTNGSAEVIVEQHSANVEETHAYHESLFHNLASEVAKVNSVNRKMKETNAELTTELARYKNQEKCDKLERCYQKSVYQEQCLTKKINALHLSSEAAKFVQDFKSLAKKADDSLAKHKALELEIQRLLRAFVSQDIMSIVQNPSIVDSSNLQTELEHTKERFENYIIKKENKYAKLWNDWYKKCEECKYDKISYDIAYNDMQQKIEWLQAQLEDQKGKSKDTSCVSNTLDPLSQKLENKNVSGQKDTTCGTSANTKFVKQLILGKPPSSSRPKLYAVTPLSKSTVFPKVGETHALLKPVTSNSVPTLTKSKFMKNDNVISPGIFSINPFKASKEVNFVPNKHVKASIRTKSITISQPYVITKNDVNSKTNDLFPKDVKSTTRTIRPQPKNNPKNDKQCLITVNHDVCVLNYVNGMNSHGKKQKANVSNIANQMKHKARSWKVYSVIYSMNYSNGENQAVSKSSVVTTADTSDKRQQQQYSPSSTTTLATTITVDGNFGL